MTKMMKLYAMAGSGNCYKVAYVLRLLRVPFEMITTTFVDGGTKSPPFLAKNPNGQVPLLELDDGRFIAESNAIMLFLAETKTVAADAADATVSGKDPTSTSTQPPLLIPTTNYERGLMYQWLFFEQYSHEPAIAVRRANLIFDGRDASVEVMDRLLAKGYHALDVMEQHFSTSSPFIVPDVDHMTIADIALYAYTHLAPEGGYGLDRYPNIRAWIKRIETSPGYVGMDILKET
jgi:glutathione S-transferase